MSPGYYIALFVSDTGGGIAPEVIPHVFEPFFTTREIGMGAGLGLAQVYGIVKQHCGYITVTSRPADETTFTFYLPAQAAPEQRLPGRKPSISPGNNLNGYFWRSAA
jgi:signal transduction histidine kinase